MRLHVPGRWSRADSLRGLSLPSALESKTMMSIRSTRFRAIYKDYKVLADKAEAINGREWQTLQFSRALGPWKASSIPIASP